MNRGRKRKRRSRCPHKAAACLLLATLGPALAPCPAAEVVIEVYPTQTYQQVHGFGAALTESSAWLLQNELTYEQRTNLLARLFDPQQGIGLTLVRHPMGASDFRLLDYTYDDMPPGQTDFGLTNFSIARDQLWLIPSLQEILSISPEVKVIGSPWSPPAWMKTTTNLYGGRLRSDAYDALSRYFLKYIQAYSNSAIPVHAVTLQNEPLYEPPDYPGMYLSATGAIRLAQLVGGLFQSNGITTEIWCYDHNWDNYGYADQVLDDPVARLYVTAAAFHGYAGDVLAQTLLHDQHPDKDIHFTELSAGDWSGGFASILEYDALNLLIGVTRNWGSSILKWNLLLDQNHGPKIAGGCDDCTGIVTLNTTNGTISYNADYYSMGHIARFVRPGAYRIGVTESSASPCATAFRNGDTNLVLIAYNDSDTARNFVIRWQGESCSYPLPPNTLATFTWPNTPGATATVWLTSADQTYLLTPASNPPVFAPLQRTWAGWIWSVKDDYGDPGGNYFSAGNVWVDASNRLHLSVSGQAGFTYAGSLNSVTGAGFGTYRWYLASNPDLLDTNLVVTFRTAFDAAHELDIHISRAFEDPQSNVYYAVQPAYRPGHETYQAATFTGDQITLEITWTPRRARFRTWYGHSQEPASTSALIGAWTYEGTDVPGDTSEWVNISLWTYAGASPAGNAEIIVQDFSYVTATGDLFYDDFEDGVLSTNWTPFNESAATITETGGRLNIQPADTDDHFCGINSSSTIHWDDDGISYRFSAVLSTISVWQAASSGGVDFYTCQGILAGAGNTSSLYQAPHAAYLRSGYDSDNDTLQLEFLTKTNAADTWGSPQFVAVISNASATLSADLELVFTLTYYQYQVEALSGGNPVAWSVISGCYTGKHQLGSLLYDAYYQLAAANRQDGRGSLAWEEANITRTATLPSTAGVQGDGTPAEKQVQIGEVDAAKVWPAPLDSRYPKHRTMVLYHADDIGRGGSITQLYLYVFGPPAVPLENYLIRAQETSIDALPGNFINTGWQTVFSGTVNIATDFTGWLAFPLEPALTISGESNLLLDFSFDQTAYDWSLVPAVAYSETSYNSIRTASATRGTPQTWSTWPGGKKFRYAGNRVLSLRLEFQSALIQLAGNLSFEHGPPGFLTNIPCWQVIGSEYAGAVKASPALHLQQSLKLWKSDVGDGSQRVVQGIEADPAQEYTLSGYIMSQSGEPFGGQDTYAALALEWYDSSGQLLNRTESAHYVPDYQYDVWLYYDVSDVPPPNAASGMIVCLLASSPSQYGSVYFDKLSLSAQPAPPSTNQVPEPHTQFLYDDFEDPGPSNIWTYVGNWDGAHFAESNGCFWVTPGTSYYQSSGYVSTNTLTWSDTNGWYVFSATLSTISLAQTKSGYDGETLLGICSERDNPWWVTNSCGLYGYYDADSDLLTFVFYTKTDAPTNLGSERCRVNIPNVSLYLAPTNRLRVSIALGQYEYELSFVDQTGEPVPLDLVGGRIRGQHNLAGKLYHAFWLVGAQSDLYDRPTVAWEETCVLHTRAPDLVWWGAAQFSTNGEGLLSLTSRVSDANGDFCSLSLEVATNTAIWSPPPITAVTGTLGATQASRTECIQASNIATTNQQGYAAPNTLTLTWDTLSPANQLDLNGSTVTDLYLRIRAFDGYVSSACITAFPLIVDNQGPAADSAWVTAATDADYTFSSVFDVTWSGFTDLVTEIRGYYCHTQDNPTAPGGQWTTASPCTVTAQAMDAVCTVFVWAVDSYGNLGEAAWDDLVVLSSNGDYDADGLANTGETVYGCSPIAPDSDGDQMYDGWEIDNGLQPADAGDGALDSDSDGYDNQGEFFAATDPHDPASYQRFFVTDFGACSLGLNWNSSTGRIYSVYWAPSLTSSWNVLPGFDSVPGTGNSMSLTDDISSVATRCYRLRVSLP